MVPTTDFYKRELLIIANRICENGTFTQEDAIRFFQLANDSSLSTAEVYVNRYWRPRESARNIDDTNLQRQIDDLYTEIARLQLRLNTESTRSDFRINTLQNRLDSILGIMESVQDVETEPANANILTTNALFTSNNTFAVSVNSDSVNSEQQQQPVPEMMPPTNSTPTFTYEIPEYGPPEAQPTTSPDTGEGSASNFLSSIYGELRTDDPFIPTTRTRFGT